MSRDRRAGFTLLEVSIGAALSAITVLGAMSMLKSFQKGSARALSVTNGESEITEIRNLIQSVFRSRYPLGPAGTTTIVPGGFPWQLSQAVFPSAPALQYTPTWRVTGPTGAIPGPCYDLVVRRHHPIAFGGLPNSYFAVEHVYFTTDCTQEPLPPKIGQQLFANDVSTSCQSKVLRFKVHSILYFGAPQNDVPVAVPGVGGPIYRATTYPLDTFKGRSTAVCFRPDPPTALSTLPFLPNGNPDPNYAKNLVVEIRELISSASDFTTGKYSGYQEKFIIPLPYSTVEFVPSVSSP